MHSKQVTEAYDSRTGVEGKMRSAPFSGALAEVERRTLRAFLRLMGNPAVEIALWNGVIVRGSTTPVAGIRIADRPTLWKFLLQPEVGFGEGYTDGRIQVQGDVLALIETVYRAPSSPLADRFLRDAGRPRRNTLTGSRHNIHDHYDLGNEFFRLWLDDEMVYTCAYYPTPDATLEEAQRAKMEHVCRKVWLRPGDRVVEAGCGWGSLALYMAREHGARVRAFNISHEQIAWARERAAREGLAERVEFVEDDYRSISGTYDVFMSVGMLEHVGLEHYRELGGVIDRCLTPNGRGLIHTIGRNRPMRLNAWIEKYIFPGGRPPTLGEMADIFEPYDFSILDVENLRLHYARTAHAWLERFERVSSQVGAMFDERFVRAWRLYLAGTTSAFVTGFMQLFQVGFARGKANDVPWTRGRVYA